MIKKIIDMDSCNFDTLRKSEKALLILSDLSTSYSFMGEKPTKKEADKLSCEAERILEYINIATDYVFEIKKDLKLARENINGLFDKVKKIDDPSNTNDQTGTSEEQNDTILNNISANVSVNENKDFMQYVYKRIDKTLEGNAEYMELQSKYVKALHDNNITEYENLSCKLDAKAQELCYIKGFIDGMNMTSGNLKLLI